MWIMILIACATGQCVTVTGNQFFETKTGCEIASTIKGNNLLNIGAESIENFAKKNKLSEEDTNKLLESLSLKTRCEKR